MTLRALAANLESLLHGFTICAKKQPVWTPECKACLCTYQQVREKRSPFPCFLKVEVAQDVVQGWSYLRAGRRPGLEQKCTALIYYAENDAFIPLEVEA